MKYTAILVVENSNIERSLQHIRDNVNPDDYKTIHIFTNSLTQKNKIEYEFFDLKNKIKFISGTADEFLQKRLSAIDNMSNTSGMQVYIQLCRLNNKFLIIGEIDQLNFLQTKYPQLSCDGVFITDPNKKQNLVLVNTRKSTKQSQSGFWNSKNLLIGITVATVGLFAAKHDSRILQSVSNMILNKFK